jgi:hypothetical protein
MALGFRFKEQPALHSVLAFSSLIVDQRALHSALILGILLGKYSPDP